MAPEMDTARMERTMRVVDYEDDKPKIKRFIEQRLEDPEAEPATPTDWDLSFDEYLEDTRIRSFCSAGTHQQSELFSVPLITAESGQDG